MSAAIPIPPNIAALTAPLILGEIFNGYLYGILSVQVYLYYLTFQNDAKYIKCLVYGVFAIDTAAFFMCIADAYHWFASGFGSMLALDDIQLSGFDTPMMGAIIAGIVQMFYCYRIYKINRNAWPISVLVVLIALAQIGAGIFGGSVAFQQKTFSQAAAKTIVGIYTIYIGASVADTIIAVTMVVLLSRARANVQQQSSFRITRIINLTAETNLLSTSLAVLTMILFLACPGTNYFTCPSIILGKIYSNSLLLILNNRRYMTTSRGNSEYSYSSGTDSSKMSTFKAGRGRMPVDTGVRVNVNTSTSTQETDYSKTEYSVGDNKGYPG